MDLEPNEILHPSDFDLLPSGICVFDRQLAVHAWNSTLEQWTGILCQEAIGHSLSELFPGLEESPVAARLLTIFDHHHVIVLSPSIHRQILPLARIGNPAGKLIQKGLVRPLPGRDGLALLVIEDVTTQFDQLEQIRNARERAEAANQAKSAFLANMSHEIRTPMTAILGYTDLLVEESEVVSRRDAAATIKRNGKHLLAVLNDVLDLSKIEAGKLRIDRRDVPLFELVDDVFRLMQVHAEAKGLQLTAEFLGRLPEAILTDSTRLRQVLLNVVGNAIKFTETGEIRVVLRLETHADGHHLVFEVHDSGMGIAPEHLATIFEPFAQGDGSVTREYGGTGLGLAICQRLVKQLGGDIDVVSELGHGSCFTLWIDPGPLAEQPLVFRTADPPVHQQMEQSPQDAHIPIRLDCRILLAEDGPDNQRLISFLLRKAGAEVEVAGNGQIACEMVLAAESGSGPAYDLVLMDMAMPVRDGYAATVELRRLAFQKPIVALTAHAMVGDRKKCLEAGCDDYLTKPIERTELIETVARLLSFSVAAD